MDKRIVVLLCLAALCINAAAQEVTIGDYVLRGTVLVRYRGYADEVIIPASLGITEIGEGVFSDYSGLSTVVIPEGVTKLGPRVFYECHDLQSLMLPQSLVEIGEYVVWGYSSLESISLPAALAIIADGAFAGCQELTTIQVDRANPYYADRDGVLFNKNFTELVAYPCRNPESNYVIPDSVHTLRGHAFSNCTQLVSVSLPAGLAGIGSSAFAGCWNLGTLQVDQANPYYVVRDGVLFNKALTELIAYPSQKTGSSYTVPEGISTIKDGAFFFCALSTVQMPASLTSIGDYAFQGCASLTTIRLPAGLTSIGQRAFYECESLATVSLPAGLTSIGDYAFQGCASLTTIRLPAGLTSIGRGVFSECRSLTTVSLSAGLTSIGDNAFYECSSLTTINLPANLTSIGDDAFSECRSLTRVTLPARLTSIGDGAFSECRSLTRVTLPAGLTSIGDYAFSGCWNLKAIQVDRANRVYADRDGVLFNKAFTELIMYPAAKTGTSHTVPASVISIWAGAFYGCDNLTTIHLPAGLTSIEDSTFADCDGLTTLSLPAGLTSIGDWAFYGCDNLTTIRLPAGLTRIGSGAFNGCGSLSSITLSSPEPPLFNGSLWSSWAEPPALIYVPAASLDQYKNANGWKNHADKIRAAED